MDSAREIILERIRDALALRKVECDSSYDAIPRAYHRAGFLESVERIEIFRNRLEEYGAGVYFASSGKLAAAVREIITARCKQNIVIPLGTPAGWLPEGIAFTLGTGLTPHELDRFDGVLTGCTVAIAMTGSLVLQNVSGQGSRRLSLIPDYHLCVVFSEQIVETVSEAFDRLEPTATLTTTFISGPSATADIEMTRIQGVHGPRFLDVLIIAHET